MTMKKMSVLREMSNEELLNRLSELRKELFLQRYKLSTGGTGGEKTHLRREIRREIARILTVLRERGITR